MRTISIILRSAARTGWSLLPYIAAGVALGELLKLLPWTRALAGVLTRRRRAALLSAGLLGAASPLCTFGTVPVVLQLFQVGVPYPPLAAFLATSSLMNPQLFLMTWGGLGPGMALSRLLAVLCFGLSLGALTRLVPASWVLNPSLTQEESAAAGPVSQGGRGGITPLGFARGFWATLQYVGFYIMLGLLLGAAAETLVPVEWLDCLFQPGRWYSVLFAALLGVPLYACGGGTIPLIRGLIGQGMSRGAALAFFLVGPATRPAPLFALAGLLRSRSILLYLLWLMVFAVLAGVIYS